MLEEELHDVCMAVLGCQPQCLVATRVDICTVLEEELHNIGVAINSCRKQRKIEPSVHVCASSKKQFHCLEVPADGSVPKGLIHNTLVNGVVNEVPKGTGLQQRRAMLVHAGSHHGANNSDVAKQARPHKATVVVFKLAKVSRTRCCVAAPRVLLSQAAQRDAKGLVHGRQAGQLHRRQVAQHENKHLLRESCSNPPEQ